MADENKKATWVWVVTVYAPEGDSIYALEDEKTGVKMLPAFQSQEDAIVCQRSMKTMPGAEYEIEAMQLPVLALAARENHADIVILDHNGKILERLTPTPNA